MLFIFLAHVLVLSVGPFVFATLRKAYQANAFYIYLGIVLFVGGFAGALYAFPLGDNLTISGGNLAYGAFMMTAVLLVITGQNVSGIRNVIGLVIGVNVFVLLFFGVINRALSDESVANPFKTNASVFSVSIPFVILGGTLIILELLFMLYCFERLKTRCPSITLLSLLYTGLFFLALLIDGVAYPVIAFNAEPSLVAIIVGGLGGKVLMASIYSLVMLIFLLIFRNSLERFAEKPLALRNLFKLPGENLIQLAQESEEKYRNLVETAHDLVWAIDEKARITFINQASMRIFGREPADLIGRPYFSVAESPNPDTAATITAALQSRSRINSYESWVSGVNGRAVLLSTNAVPMFDDRGRLTGIMGTSQDITERKQTETALKESEARYRQLFENSPAATIEQDFSGMKSFLDALRASGVDDIQVYLETHPEAIDRCLEKAVITIANRVAIDMYGLHTDAELISRFNVLLKAHDDATYRTQARSLAAIANGNTTFEGEFVNLRSNGERFEFLLRWAVLPGYEQTYERVLITGLDITPLKMAQQKTEAALDRERDARIQAETLRNTAETLVRTTAIDESLNLAARLLHDLIPFDALAIHVVEQNNLRPVVRQGDRGPIAAPEPLLTDYTLIPSLIRALSTGTALRPTSTTADQGTMSPPVALGEGLRDWIAIPLIARNITIGLLSIGTINRVLSMADLEAVSAFGAQIALAIDSARVNSDLEKSYAQLQTAQAGLIQAARLSAIGELAAGIAHQINNPLMTVIADSYLILKHVPTDSPQRESAEAVNRAAHKAGHIVQRLLDFARAAPTHMEATDINESIQEAINLVRPQIEPRYAEIHLELAPGLPMIRGSDDHLQDIWMNLLLNARDAVRNEAQGQITITTAYDHAKGQVRVSITDNGAGIPPEDLGHIFEPFFTTKVQGTGLGLAVVAEIVRRHEGEVQVDSTPGRGTTFTMTFPLL